VEALRNSRKRKIAAHRSSAEESSCSDPVVESVKDAPEHRDPRRRGKSRCRGGCPPGEAISKLTQCISRSARKAPCSATEWPEATSCTQRTNRLGFRAPEHTRLLPIRIAGCFTAAVRKLASLPGSCWRSVGVHEVAKVCRSCSPPRAGRRGEQQQAGTKPQKRNGPRLSQSSRTSPSRAAGCAPPRPPPPPPPRKKNQRPKSSIGA